MCPYNLLYLCASLGALFNDEKNLKIRYQDVHKKYMKQYIIVNNLRKMRNKAIRNKNKSKKNYKIKRKLFDDNFVDYSTEIMLQLKNELFELKAEYLKSQYTLKKLCIYFMTANQKFCKLKHEKNRLNKYM